MSKAMEDAASEGADKDKGVSAGIPLEAVGRTCLALVGAPEGMRLLGASEGVRLGVSKGVKPGVSEGR